MDEVTHNYLDLITLRNTVKKIDSLLLMKSTKSFKALWITAAIAVVSYLVVVALREPSPEEKLSKLLKKAKAGDSTAQYELAVAYLHGEGGTHEPEEIVKWYQRASEGGNAKAQIELANHYYSIDQWNLGAAWLTKAAEQGDAHAQVSLGVILQKGQGVEIDRAKAAVWLEKSAEQNNRLAQYLTARCYYLGDGRKKDNAKVVYWMRKAAENGHLEACYGLGVLYDLGQGVEVNAQEAVRWYRKAADCGMRQAQRNLGICYLEGFGVERDIVKAAELLEKAAKYDGANAYELHLIYSTGMKLGFYDPEKAKEWLDVAVKYWSPDAMSKYGEMLWYGRDVPKDQSAGAKLINKAAFERQANAMFLKGLLADNKQMEEGAVYYAPAHTWIYGAAEKGLHEAQFLTGLYFIENNDAKSGASYLRKAALQGNIKAQRELGRILYFGIGIPKDEVEGYAFLNLAAGSDVEVAKIRAVIEKTLPTEARLTAQKRTGELSVEIDKAVQLAEKPFTPVRSSELPECSKY